MKIPQEWTFKNKEIADNFDKHVREQIPWYDIVTSAVAHIARHYIPENGTVYDFGASTGNIGRALNDIIKSRNVTFIPVEASPEIAAIYEGPGGLIVKDALQVDIKSFDVAICFLSLMFFDISQRKSFINKLISKMNVGGCIIIIDKINFKKGGYISTVLYRLTLAAKKKAGISGEDIIDKELSLSGIQRPIDENFFDSFENSIQFFKFGNFSGWVIEKNNL